MFSKKNYHYFVSVFCRNKPFTTEVLLPKKTTSYRNIYWLTNACALQYNVHFDDIVVSNYKLLRQFRY